MITIFEYFGYDIPINERYRLIKQAGFNGVLAWWSDEFGDINFRSNPEIARKQGLFIENIHTTEYVNDLWFDNLKGQQIINNLLRYIEDCAIYEISTMVVHLTEGNKPPALNDIGLNRIKIIAEKAEHEGINIALENLRHNIPHLQYILSNVQSKRIGFCYDSRYDSNNQNLPIPNVDLLSKYRNRLMALHLHDNNGSTIPYLTHLLPFDGTINWFNTMKKISELHYHGATALEVMNYGYEHLSAEEFLSKAYQVAIKLEELRNVE